MFDPYQQRKFTSPLRYPGGKGKIANYLKLLLLENDLVGCRYVEPYAGGASVALSLLYEEYATHIHINDLNRSVHAFWDAVLNSTDELCARIRGIKPCMTEWERQRAVQGDADADALDLAFSTFFLNRTNRSGIIDGGVIGGKNQTGDWKIDARFNKDELIRRIKKISRYKTRITLTRVDAAEYLRNQLPAVPGPAVVYLDPPYYVKGEGLYEHFYQHEDHTEIARLVGNIDRPWLVSYDAAPEILELYNAHEPIRYGVRYSAAERYEGAEVMFLSPGLIPPDVTSPANIPFKEIDQVRLDMLEAA